MSKRKIVLVLLMGLGSMAFAAPYGWHLFRSTAGFSVLYPGTWVRNGVSADRLQVRSSRGGAEGIGIKQGQAEITVMEAPESTQKTLAQVVPTTPKIRLFCLRKTFRANRHPKAVAISKK